MEPSCPQQQIAYEYILYWSSSHPHRCFPQPVPVVLISMSSLEETQTKNPNSLGICLFVCFLGLLQQQKKKTQTGCLRTAEMDCLTVLEARSPKSRCWQGYAPPKP